MSEKSKVGEKKKIDKTLIIISIISVVLVVGIILAIVLPDRINAAVRMREYKDFLKALENDEVIVLISSPTDEGDEILSSASERLEGDSAKELVAKVKTVTENVKYSDTEAIELGIWEIKIVIYSSTDKYTAYIDGNNLYLTHNGKKIAYTQSNKSDNSLAELYSEVEGLVKK